MKERLSVADYRFIAICLALLAVCIWFAAGNFYRANPEASIDFRVTRDDAQSRAQHFLDSQGYTFQDYRVASSFSYDDDAKTFLEREAGLEKANQLMATRVRLWRWAFRWFRPQQKEEFRAAITPAGDFVEFEHAIAEDAARPDITAEQARALAENFLRTRAHRDTAALDFVETSNVVRPHRTDRSFTWKERDFDIHDGTYRIAVTVHGDEVAAYNEYLKIPDRWSRDYQRLRSKNDEAQIFDTLALVGLLIGLIVVLVKRVRRQDVRWRRAAVVGVIGMALSFLASLNEFPLAEFGYRTTDSYSSFLVQNLLQAALNALAWGGGLFILAAGAEVLYREAFAEKISMGNLFSRRGLRTKRFFLGAILGVTLCAIFLAYQTAFYIVANKLGAWAPAEVPYSDLLNTKFPWLYVLLGGYLPALSEELLFRMFAIPFLRKIVRWLPAAIVLAGFIWGFGHAGYPNQPFFIRGLEVGIGGVALGLIMLRWGILPTIVWHYSVDAMYSALLLLRSHSLYFRLSGAASAGIFVVPIVVALVAYWRRGGFEPATGLLNGDEPGAAEPPAESPRPAVHILDYWPLSGRMRLLAIALFVVSLASGWIPAAHFGDSPRYKLMLDQARANADAFLRALGIDPNAYRHVTYPDTHWGGADSLAGKYFLERRPLSAASKLFEQYRPVYYWRTRYFKPLENDEITIEEHPETGKVMGYIHEIPETRPGADLTPDAARHLAEQFAIAHGLDVAAMDLKESQSEKRKARRDYSLIWEARAGDPRNVDQARYRVNVDVYGDQVSAFYAWWKVPESFVRSRERQSFFSIAAFTVRSAVTAAGIIFGLWMLIRQVRHGLVPWRRSLLLAIVPTLMLTIAAALSFQLTLYRNYDNAVPVDTQTATLVVQLAMQLVFAYVVAAASVAFVLSFFPQSLTAFGSGRRILARDAVVLLFLAIGLSYFWHRLASILADAFHSVALVDVDYPSLIGLPLPAFAALTHGVQAFFTRAAVLAIGVLAARKLPRRWMLVPLALLAACVLVSEDVRTPAEFALEYLLAVVGIGLIIAFCLWFARTNYLAYALVVGTSAVYGVAAELLHSGNAGLQMQAGIVLAVVFLGVAWAVRPG